MSGCSDRAGTVKSCSRTSKKARSAAEDLCGEAFHWYAQVVLLARQISEEREGEFLTAAIRRCGIAAFMLQRQRKVAMTMSLFSHYAIKIVSWRA